MLTDIEIIKKSKVEDIKKVSSKYDLKEEELFYYGRTIAKVDLSALKRLENEKDGKLILVTAITPTPAGEGKSTTTIGLVDALNKIGKNTIGAIREPSLGPVFGIKGGAAGGGYAQVNPMVELNLHFTGDIHAITTANNLISAFIDNHIYFGNELKINPEKITWKRAMDLNDRALRKVRVGLSLEKETPRYDAFNITVASEIMAVLCLATSFADLRTRLENMIVAYTYDNKVITVKDLKIVGSLMVLLKDAIKPNLIQTLENNMIIAHGGPFANIAHGCNSILATRLALKLSDYVITEAGFGADLGAEKFLDIKCREASLNPNLIVLVATIRALKYHGGMDIGILKEKSVTFLEKGIPNLERHLKTIKEFNIPCVIALNKFETDSEEEIKFMENFAKKMEVPLSLSEVFSKGSDGGIDLAKKVIQNIENTNAYKPIYDLDDTIENKIKAICTKVYGAKDVIYKDEARKYLDELEKTPYSKFYICMAKTPLSITDNPKITNIPSEYTITIKEIRVSAGAKFIVCLTGDIMTMPGLCKEPMALKVDIDNNMEVYGLM